MPTDNNIAVLLFMLIAAAVLFVVLVLVIVQVVIPFTRDRNYIKMEIDRADNEKDYKFWKKQLKRLYLKHIPIVGFFIK